MTTDTTVQAPTFTALQAERWAESQGADLHPDDPDARRDARRSSQQARQVLWSTTTLTRVRGCGRWLRKDTDAVRVRLSTDADRRRAGISGVQSCGSVWACPCCAAKVNAQRETDLHAALAEWHQRGGRVGFVTLTMRHRSAHSIENLWNGLSDAWARVTSGRSWVSEQDQHGVMSSRVVKSGKAKGQTVHAKRIGIVRAVEATHGANGWHLHVHALLFLAPGTTSTDVDLLGAQMFERWSRALVRSGLPRPSFERGVDARLLTGDPSAELADYFTKANYSGAAELTRHETKAARKSNRTPFQILRDVVAGDADSLDLWRDWEQGSAGRRQMTWSQGLRADLVAEPELTDDEIAAAEAGGEVVAVIEKRVWVWITGEWLVSTLLEAAEKDDDGLTLAWFLEWACASAPPPRDVLSLAA